MAQKEAIMRALMEAMGSSPSAPMTSPRPPRRPRGLGEAGKTISDMQLSPAQIKMLEQMIKQQNRVRDAAERKAFPPASMMNGGGVVRKSKPKKGCVMKGRGGKYKGIK